MILVDSKEVAKGHIEQTVPVRVSADETLDIGLQLPDAPVEKF